MEDLSQNAVPVCRPGACQFTCIPIMGVRWLNPIDARVEAGQREDQAR